MGSISAWLPSRRSTLHHSGGLLSTTSGQQRSGSGTGAKGRYLLAGFWSMDMTVSGEGDNTQPELTKQTARCVTLAGR